MPFLPTSRPARLVDGRTDPAVLVQATVVRDAPPSRLEDIERYWRPAREQAARALAQTGAGVEHSHWDWENKVRTAGSGHHRIVTVECGGKVQGAMAALGEPRPSAILPEGGPVIYVDYLETAPWNLKWLPTRPQFLGVGTLLIAEAVLMSLEAGWGGRIGLHSLPGAERFYQTACQMTMIGRDPDYHDLVYFEFTQAQSSAWLTTKGLDP
jgi:hypothetical protein